MERRVKTVAEAAEVADEFELIHENRFGDSAGASGYGTDTGDKILMGGMGMHVLPVPVHRMCLDCELLQSEVHIGVRPALPVEGVDMILGNNLAGSRVWKTVLPSPVVTESPSSIQEPDDSAKPFPEVFPVLCSDKVNESHQI